MVIQKNIKKEDGFMANIKKTGYFASILELTCTSLRFPMLLWRILYDAKNFLHDLIVGKMTHNLQE